MPTSAEQHLSQATVTTFEELAMLFPELQLSPEQSEAPMSLAASVDFRGPLAGRLVVRASVAALETITASMTGADRSRPVPLQRDALGEVANVICGNVLPLIAGPDAVMNLASPVIHASGRTPFRARDIPVASLAIGVEDGRVEVQLFIFDTEAVEARTAPSFAAA